MPKQVAESNPKSVTEPLQRLTLLLIACCNNGLKGVRNDRVTAVSVCYTFPPKSSFGEAQEKKHPVIWLVVEVGPVLNHV
jgi:hypothetical protein